ncbi:MAG: hypothetical protein PHC75_10450 [Burkholderiales bacterium]|nr:hypothetical protein [Burkholderiales bacterium]
MKKILLTILSCTATYSAYASSYSVDGYHTQIPCFRFAVKAPSGVDTKFDYVLDNAKGERLQSGQITANKANSNIIQWCDNDLSHVQKKGDLTFDSKYVLTFSGIKYKEFTLGTSIQINLSTTASSFINNYSIYSMSASPVSVHDKTVHVGEVANIQYNDILKIENTSFQHAQFGSKMPFSPYACSGGDPACGDIMNYKHSDSRTWWGFSLFRKTWLISDIVLPENISAYHTLNSSNLKIKDEAHNFDYVYNVYDNNDQDTDDIIQFNIRHDLSDPNHVAHNLRTYFSGFCSGIGVVNGVLYATCRTDNDLTPTSLIYPENLIRQSPTYLSYKTACSMFTENDIKGALIKTKNGILQCDSYRSDFPQGEYLKSCTGINYEPNNRKLITDCYDDSGHIKHSTTNLGVLGITTPHYKNVNGSLVAY